MIVRCHGVGIALPDSFRPTGTEDPAAPVDLTVELVAAGRDPHFTLDDVVAARLDGTVLTTWPLRETGPFTLEHYVLDHAVPRALTVMGMPIMHAAGVALDGRGVLFSGLSGAGKSTLSLWLAGRGWSFYGDDGIRTEVAGGRLDMFPALANARIHPDVHQRFFAGHTVAGPVADYGAKVRLQVPPDSMATAPCAVAMYVTVDPETRPERPELDPISKAGTAMHMAEQTFWASTDDGDAVARLDAGLERTTLVRGYRLAYARVPEVLPALEEMLRAELAVLGGQPT